MGNVSDALPLERLGAESTEHSPLPQRELLGGELLETESSFYGSYRWCLNAVPPIEEIVAHLRWELGRADEMAEEWQRAEVMTNVFLLSCAITDTMDDYLVGERYDLSQITQVLPLVGPGVRATEWLLAALQKFREARLSRVREWRENWVAAVAGFLRVFVAPTRARENALSDARAELARLLSATLPADFRAHRPRIPAAFRTQDLTHFDILTLGRTFAASFPDRQRPILVVGLRTAGSYFGLLLRAYLETEDYQDVDLVTIRVKKGIAAWERARLARVARAGGLALIIDEPPGSGGTLAKAMDLVRKAGFAASDVVALLPVHPTRLDWASSYESLPLRGIHVLTLQPEQWYKNRLLEPHVVEGRLAEYFERRKFFGVRVMESETTERLNSGLQRLSEQKYHTRLKRIYEVQLQNEDCLAETRYVLAKSVGWGWLGYHAVFVASRLSEFVPPVLGLRDGILYTEWLPQRHLAEPDGTIDRLIGRAASYVAARVRSLGLGRDPSPGLSRADQHKGFVILAETLSRAYGWKIAAVLKRSRIRHELSRCACPVPTLIDGKMRREEWVNGSSELLKTDFEHHGLGKTELNMTDPAYDLAEVILHFELSQNEEHKLIARYIEECGDAGVEERLFLNKLLAGRWAMKTALDNLADPRLAHRHQDFNHQYIEAWNFLTVHAARLCGGFCGGVSRPCWHAPLVVMDIDGVLDKQIFGFPSTTAAGIHAVALLQAHDVAVAVNTARTVSEVKEYCCAYGFAGGVAEYGGVVWDAVTGREEVLVSRESLAQLERVRNALRQIPGVFLNDRYRYSIRAYTYERGTTVPLPTILIRNLMASLKVERLTFLQTYVDTTVLAKEVDKGSGLRALLTVTGQGQIETIAIGDSEADLPMFQVADRSFAPSHISGRAVARQLGCRIADRSYQSGLLDIVQSIVHPNGRRCDRCRSCDPHRPKRKNLFWELLEAADRTSPSLFLRALLDPLSFQVFVR